MGIKSSKMIKFNNWTKLEGNNWESNSIQNISYNYGYINSVSGNYDELYVIDNDIKVSLFDIIKNKTKIKVDSIKIQAVNDVEPTLIMNISKDIPKGLVRSTISTDKQIYKILGILYVASILWALMLIPYKTLTIKEKIFHILVAVILPPTYIINYLLK